MGLTNKGVSPLELELFLFAYSLRDDVRCDFSKTKK